MALPYAYYVEIEGGPHIICVTHAEESSTTPADALAGKLKRTELQHSASSVPGREIVPVLTEIPAGVESGWLSTCIVEVGEPLRRSPLDRFR